MLFVPSELQARANVERMLEAAERFELSTGCLRNSRSRRLELRRLMMMWTGREALKASNSPQSHASRVLAGIETRPENFGLPM